MDAVRQNPIRLTCKPLQRMCNNRMQHITTIRSSLLMFPLTPDQHHWLDVATEDEGWCSFRSCTPSIADPKTFPCNRLSWLPVSFLLHVKYTLFKRILAAKQPRVRALILEAIFNTFPCSFLQTFFIYVNCRPTTLTTFNLLWKNYSVADNIR